jgi:hypothetical protein
MCHRILALDRGRIVLSGPTVEILPQILNRGRRPQPPIATDSNTGDTKGTTSGMAPSPLAQERFG